jgi:hypothetical protein
MQFKHLSLALLAVASTRAAFQFKSERPAQDRRYPFSDLGGSSNANGWDFIADENPIKRMCKGPQRDATICKQFEEFHNAVKLGGIKAREEIRTAEQTNAQKPFNLELIESETNTLANIIAKNLASSLDPSKIQNLATKINASDEDLAEVLSAAPLLIFAYNAGTTRIEQRTILSICLALLMQAAQQQQQQNPFSASFK